MTFFLSDVMENISNKILQRQSLEGYNERYRTLIIRTKISFDNYEVWLNEEMFAIKLFYFPKSKGGWM